MQSTGATGSFKKPRRGEEDSSIFPRGYLSSFFLVTAIFFIWGMSNNLTDILVQQFRKTFELDLIRAQLVQTAVYLAYAVMAAPAALLTRRYGYKVGLVTGLVTFGIGTLAFWPAALVGLYVPFLIALFIVGCGSSILETAANPLIAQFGSAHTAEQRLNFAQAFNPPGTITGVLLGTFFVFSGVEKSSTQVAAMKGAGTYAAYLQGEILRVVPIYVGLGCVVLLLALLISRARFPAFLDAGEAVVSDADEGTGRASERHAYRRLLRNPHLMLAVGAQFFYVGAQVSIWSALIPYLRAYTSVSERQAGYFLTATLVAFALGRIVFTPLMRYVRPARMMCLFALINLGLLGLGIAHPGLTGAGAILATSLFMSMMYPTIFALGVKGLGDDTKVGGSLLVIAIIGGAIFPPLTGLISHMRQSTAAGYLLPASSFVVVAVYAWIVQGMSEAPVNIAPENL